MSDADDADDVDEGEDDDSDDKRECEAFERKVVGGGVSSRQSLAKSRTRLLQN